jgi:hypothetical protein
MELQSLEIPSNKVSEVIKSVSENICKMKIAGKCSFNIFSRHSDNMTFDFFMTLYRSDIRLANEFNIFDNVSDLESFCVEDGSCFAGFP